MLFPRRLVLTLCAAALAPRQALADAAAPASSPSPPAVDLRDLQVPGDRALGRRFTLLVPRRPISPSNATPARGGP
ncbi:hypothetical protein WMF39_35385 [Sorangium sp. So ce1504]|uniref:hypothetical protein n=1 Tax=Sorangium sp. So ce1504 TaxID=3133337 RepID=UPI003F60AC9C